LRFEAHGFDAELVTSGSDFTEMRCAALIGLRRRFRAAVSQQLDLCFVD
jgi:hypothetical protein